MPFSPSILATVLAASPASSSKFVPALHAPYPVGDGNAAIVALDDGREGNDRVIHTSLR
jgi:hypothetical protein